MTTTFKFLRVRGSKPLHAIFTESHPMMAVSPLKFGFFDPLWGTSTLKTIHND